MIIIIMIMLMKITTTIIIIIIIIIHYCEVAVPGGSRGEVCTCGDVADCANTIKLALEHIYIGHVLSMLLCILFYWCGTTVIGRV